MPRSQRGETVGAVGPGVLLVADAEQGGVEQPHDNRQQALPCRPVAPELVLDHPTQAGEARPEGREIVELGRLALGAKVVVVAVLLAAPCVAPGGLEVPVGARGDPDIRPCRRNRQRPDALPIMRADRRAVGTDVTEPSVAQPSDAVLGVTSVAHDRPVPVTARSKTRGQRVCLDRIAGTGRG